MKMKLKMGVIVILSFILAACAATSEKAPDVNLSDQAFEAIAAGDYEKAEALLEVALSINPNNPYALLNLGVVYHHTGRIDKAREAYVKVILLNSQETISKSNVKGLEGEKLVDIARRNLENL
jgi:Flp pilus assembly protein TadD